MEKKLFRLRIAFAFGSIALMTSSCFSGDRGDSVTAQDVCGGLSEAAASAMEKITATEEFGKDSVSDKGEFTDALLSDLKAGREGKKREFCRVHPDKNKDSPVPRIHFGMQDRDDIPPEKETAVVGEEDFPFALRATSTYTSADVYFECRSTSTERNSREHPVVHGKLSYGPRLVGGEGGLDAIKLHMDILQHVARNIAGELGCEDHGDIPERDEPW
ncbi:hypothetical protein [Streptomyces radiopugnans]|uniref:hypothetical protein n=1 Tax=Streptomyces radiopugnans TaxID=403935 RepID=UPI001160A675|nr:hypothetical protein [Streptomyces radiopugnans]